MTDYFEHIAAQDRARAGRIAAALDRIDKTPLRRIVAADVISSALTLIEASEYVDYVVDEALERVEAFLNGVG